jgi:hypothetical protein
LEGGGRDLIEVLSRSLPRRAEEMRENLNQDRRFSCRDSNRAPPEYKLRAIKLDQPLWFHYYYYYYYYWPCSCWLGT